MLYGVLGIVVVCRPSAHQYVTDVLWLTGRPRFWGTLLTRLINPLSQLFVYKIWRIEFKGTFSNLGLNGRGRKMCIFNGKLALFQKR